MRKLKCALLALMKLTGIFHVCRRMHARGLRILCYHGFSIDDQHAFRDVLFMRTATFRRRMALLQKWRFNVIPLSEAIESLEKGNHPDHAVVITFDDGWATTYSQALPLLERFRFPATIYVATYYAIKQKAVFNVLVAYLFWKTKVSGYSLSGWHADIDGYHAITDSKTRGLLAESIMGVGKYYLDSEQRERLLQDLALALEVSLEASQQARLFHYMSIEQLRDSLDRGVDLQLHTHRHKLVIDKMQVMREIKDNRAVLDKVKRGHYQDFCYPSGRFSEEQFSWFKSLNIRSATTCIPGFNYPDSCPFRLGRFLDRETLTDLEFEAEICGVLELFRRLRGRTTPKRAENLLPKAVAEVSARSAEQNDTQGAS